MNARASIALVACLVLGLLCASRLASLARRSGLRTELAARGSLTLSDETREALAQLQDDVQLVYYASRPSDVPSPLRHLLSDVRTVLAALQEASNGKLRHAIVFPDEAPELADYFAELGLSRFRARRVERDGWTEQSLWSSLRIASGAKPDVTLHALTPELLPHLQEIVVAHLSTLATEERGRPVFALAAPTSGFTRLEALLSETGDVRRIDLDADAQIPAGIDLLFWMEPATVTTDHLRELGAFLETGRPAVIAARGVECDVTLQGDEPRASFSGEPGDARRLFAEFGLLLNEGLVLDQRGELLELSESDVRELPFALRCIAPQQDFRALGSQPNGTLSFTGARPLELDEARILEHGYRPTILASTSTRARAIGFEEAAGPTRTLTERVAETGPGARRRPLLCLLESDDPWRGSVVLAASASPFRDANLARDETADRGLVRVLTSELADELRLSLNRSGMRRPEVLPELSGSARLLWRALCVVALPALLGVLVLRQRRAATERGAAAPTPLFAPTLLGLAGCAALSFATARLDLASDLTRDGLHGLAPEEESLVRAALENGARARLELVRTDPARFPLELVAPLRETRSHLQRLAASFEGLEFETRDHASLDAATLAELRAAGIEPRHLSSREDEVTVVRELLCCLRVTLGERSTLLALSEPAEHEHLRFRVAFALWRLQRGREVTVALSSDVGRLSAAEAQVDYQQQGLFTPTEADAYGAARALLERNDFRVLALDPRAPEADLAGVDPDAVVWLQPRRDIEPMLRVVVSELARGGKALIAAQHYRILPRQLLADELRTTFWPRPQQCDLERFYFPELGIRLEREVFLDSLNAPVELDTRIERGARRASGGQEHERQLSAQPFMVRAVEAGFAADEPLVAGVGDLLFESPNRIVLDASMLGERGLVARPLIRSSSRAWTFDWRGDDLPEEVLRGPPEGSQEFLPERATLACRVSGPFPPLEFETVTTPDGDEVALPRAGTAERDAPHGTLVLVGSSSAFRDEALAETEFRSDALLLDVVSTLACGDELGRLAARRAAPAGLDWIEPRDKLRWRAIVLLAGPLSLLAGGALFKLLRRRARPR